MDNIKTSSDIGNLIRQQETDYTSGQPVQISEYVEYDMFEDLNKIDAYDNSRHVSGSTDSKGREKPFFNIVKSVVNIWYRATDIDRKNIRIYSQSQANYISAFIASIYLQNWMKKSRFGVFLNKWGRMLAKYGSTVVKFVEKDGELHSMVIDWHKFICDPIDFSNNPQIEVLDLTPAQLRARGYDEEVVDALRDDLDTRKTLKGHQQDQREGYIRIYEVHGELPLSYLTDNEEDEDTFQQMMIVYSFTGNQDEGFTDYFLYRGKETKSPYMLTHLIEEDGKTLSTGAIKQLFESQWMVNHSMKAIKDIVDLSSKLILQTSDENFVGKNAITSIETGDIMVTGVNQGLSPVSYDTSAIVQAQNFKAEWQAIGNEQTGASDAMRGMQPKSGTAWRQTEAILNENYSLFEVMTENKGLAIEDMLREHVLTFIKRKLNSKDEIIAILDSFNLKKLDKMYLKAKAQELFEKKAKEDIKAALLKGELPAFIDQEQEIATNQEMLQENLADLGNERFLIPSEIDSKTWKDIFKDLEWEVEVDVTGEAKDLQGELTTLNSLYVNLMNSGQTEDGRKVLEKILEITGAFSPIELTQLQAQPAPQATSQPQTPVEEAPAV